jgi:hypothetical protein
MNPDDYRVDNATDGNDHPCPNRSHSVVIAGRCDDCGAVVEVECPDCFGDGGEQGPDLDERGRPVRVPCGCCGGTGRVEA